MSKRLTWTDFEELPARETIPYLLKRLRASAERITDADYKTSTLDVITTYELAIEVSQAEGRALSDEFATLLGFLALAYAGGLADGEAE